MGFLRRIRRPLLLLLVLSACLALAGCDDEISDGSIYIPAGGTAPSSPAGGATSQNPARDPDGEVPITPEEPPYYPQPPEPHPPSPPPITIVEPEVTDCTIVQVAAGAAHTCAVTADGVLYCWGSNSAYQLGTTDSPETCAFTQDGVTTEFGCNSLPQRVRGLPRIVSVTGGTEHTCALSEDGLVFCWGGNNSSTLGVASSQQCVWGPCESTPRFVTGGIQYLHAWGQTCVAGNDGSAGCWGFHMPTLTWIAGLSGVIAINDGCALGDDGRVKCWGSNREGALGADVTGDCSGPWNAPCSDQPVAVVGVTEAIALSSGWEHSCALIADGTVKCWGTNFYGQLGLLATQTDNCGYWSCSRTATVVPGLSDVQAIAAGFGYTCALNQDGQVLCLGKVNTGPIPLQEFAPPEASIATEVQLSDPVKLIGTGRDVMCAATVNDELYCWGRNEEGELGTGDRDPHDDPVRVRLCQ